MIISFKHKGLALFFEHGDARGIKHDQSKRIRRILAILDVAADVADLGRLPGMRLHPLKGDMNGLWSLTVSGNWRIVFRFRKADAYDVDLVDYH